MKSFIDRVRRAYANGEDRPLAGCVAVIDEHNSKQADGPDLADVSGVANGGRPDL